MKKIRIFAALCCIAAVFAACDKSDEPKNDEPKNDEPKATTGTENGYDWVDLGLSVKWATCNVGADNPEAYGNYYAWGEIEPKETYSWDTYKHGTYSSDRDYSKLTKYNQTDGLTTLEAADDAATSNWGGSWRMPTSAELNELIEKCTWTWTADYDSTGVAGYVVASKSNDNSIFLPVAGFRVNGDLNNASSIGYYWSSLRHTDFPDKASYAYFASDKIRMFNSIRSCGFSVRPVLK